MLDAVIISTLPQDVHELMKERGYKFKLPRALHACPMSIDTSETYLEVHTLDGKLLQDTLLQYPIQRRRLYITIAQCMIHAINPHDPTCAKGKSGEKQCRAAKPSGENNNPTGINFIDVFFNSAGTKVYGQRARPDDFSPPQPNPSNPFQQNDDIAWVMELHKPAIDGTVIDGPIPLIIATGANCCEEITTNPEAAKGQARYLGKYLGKGFDGLKVSALLLESINTTAKYPSTAADTGTDIRTTTHILQRLANNWIGQEIQTAATCAMSNSGMPSEFMTHIPIFVDVAARTRDVNRLLMQANELESSDSDSETSDSDSNDDDEEKATRLDRAAEKLNEPQTKPDNIDKAYAAFDIESNKEVAHIYSCGGVQTGKIVAYFFPCYIFNQTQFI